MARQTQFFESKNFVQLQTIVNDWLMQKREKPISIIGIYPANYVDSTSQDSDKLRHTLVILYEDPALDRNENVKQEREDNISDKA